MPSFSDFNTRAPWRPAASGSAEHTGELIGERDVAAGGRRANRVLYVLPRGGWRATVVAFPGDAVPHVGWHPLAGAAGRHPHSGGLLAILRERLRGSSGRLADAGLFVVEPARVESSGAAVYENLLQSCTATGEPLGYSSTGRRAATHLAALLEAAAEAAGAHGGPPQAAHGPLVVLTFSKGCVVANQLLTELALLPTGGNDTESAGARLLGALAEVHYLDAGLQCRGAHLTDPAVAAALGKRSAPPRVALHGTPRQWRDQSRPWLAEEKARSAALLRDSGLRVVEREYLSQERPSLHMHFRCVDLFELDCFAGCGEDSKAGAHSEKRD